MITEFMELSLVAANVGSPEWNAGRSPQLQVHLQLIWVCHPE
ncbi:hypothetical protein yberc0001_38990 [Yersinia bercovieri ATCC 43970]|uniref:Uncharacterized protein n=1 Tax=Yersinia bercovieri ATCC 43970 TaxID=349968 RepID=A0ABP2DX06_YERBE|nr:hypothetical protein yberc0001_38990 [Yersinia bercovieri ATCC 43970]